MKEILVELLNKIQRNGSAYTPSQMDERLVAIKEISNSEIADYLLANGVTFPPVKVGQTVWVYNRSTRNIYKNTVICLKIAGENKYKNTIVVEYINPYGESSRRKFTWAQVGKQVFLTEEEAVEALVKGATDERT